MLMKRFSLIMAVLMLFCIAGCSSKNTNSTPETQKSSVTFKDDMEREVTVTNPQRVATLTGSFADVWYLAGGEIVAAPDDAWEDFDLPLSKDTVNLGTVKTLSLEKLLSANPDFIIASSNIKIDLDIKQTLENSKIPVAYFNVSDFNDYLKMLKICTDITGRADLYQKNGLDVQKHIQSVIKDSEKRVSAEGSPTVLSLRASSASIRAKNSKGNVIGEMLKSLGCENIADKNDSLLENLSIEYIIERDPDFIFIVQMGDDNEGTQKKLSQFIAENPAWNKLKAVKENKVFFMDKHLYNMKPNARWGEAYEKLEKILNDNK